ncbi:MAG: hypothetical protein FWG96_04645 [Methanomassiliicoccaceae archaeon]|nr:hypothetical protein [Methanomassiliicoccaceae archaeon]
MAVLSALAALAMIVPSAAILSAEEEGFVNGEDDPGTDLFTPTAATESYVAAGTIIMKLSSTGELLWGKNLLLSGFNLFMSATVVPDGFVAVGSSIAKYNNAGDRVWQRTSGSLILSAVTAASDGFTAAGSRGNDAAIAKYDNSGSRIWDKTFGVPGSNVSFRSITAVSDGFVAVGTSNEIIRNGNTTWYGPADGIIVKYSGTGDVVWQNSFGGDSSDYFNSVAAVPGGVVVAGESAGYANIVKYGDDGAVVWQKSLSREDADSFKSVAAVPGGFVAAGDVYHNTYGSRDGAVVKFDDMGEVIWKKSFGGVESDYFESVAATESGFIAIGDSYYRSFGTGDLVGVESKDDSVNFIAVKFNDIGEAEWVYNFGGIDIKGMLSSLTAGIWLWFGISAVVAGVLIGGILLFSLRKPKGAMPGK